MFRGSQCDLSHYDTIFLKVLWYWFVCLFVCLLVLLWCTQEIQPGAVGGHFTSHETWSRWHSSLYSWWCSRSSQQRSTRTHLRELAVHDVNVSWQRYEAVPVEFTMTTARRGVSHCDSDGDSGSDVDDHDESGSDNGSQWSGKKRRTTTWRWHQILNLILNVEV